MQEIQILVTSQKCAPLEYGDILKKIWNIYDDKTRGQNNYLL